MRNTILAVSLFLVAFVGLIKYSLSAGPRLQGDSKLVLNEFLLRSRSRRYDAAHQLFTDNLQDSMSVTALVEQWGAFEKAHGSLHNWRHMDGMVSLGWPRYVDSIYKITGRKNGAGALHVRMTPENGTWRVDRLLIRP